MSDGAPAVAPASTNKNDEYKVQSAILTPPPPPEVDVNVLRAQQSVEQGGTDEREKAQPAAEVSDLSYDDQTKDELEALAEERGLEVKGSGADGNVLKADLVAALEADDK